MPDKRAPSISRQFSDTDSLGPPAFGRSQCVYRFAGTSGERLCRRGRIAGRAAPEDRHGDIPALSAGTSNTINAVFADAIRGVLTANRSRGFVVSPPPPSSSRLPFRPILPDSSEELHL